MAADHAVCTQALLSAPFKAVWATQSCVACGVLRPELLTSVIDQCGV